MRGELKKCENNFFLLESKLVNSFESERRKMFDPESKTSLKISKLHENYKLRLRREKIDDIINNCRFKSFEKLENFGIQRL